MTLISWTNPLANQVTTALVQVNWTWAEAVSSTASQMRFRYTKDFSS